MTELTIIHNPRCSKSRQTLALLEQQGLAPQIVEYLKTPLSAQQIESIMNQLGFQDPRQMMRVKEAAYIDNNLAAVTDASKLIEAMASHPKLIERPIVINGNKARIGRPPESVLDIL